MQPSPDTIACPPGAKCLTCGYELRGLPEPLCPECGREFNPTNWRTMNVPGHKPVRSHDSTFGGQMIAVSICTVVFAVVSRIPTYGMCLWHAVIFAAWAGMLIAWFVRRGNKNSPNRRPEGPENWRAWVLICLLISSILCVRIVNCGHTTSIGFGLVGVSFGGRPCHNPPHDGGVHLFGPVYLAYFRDIP